MSDDKLILKINKSDSKESSLSSLNVEETDTLISLMTSLRDLCDNAIDSKNLKIELKEGSIVTALRGPSSSMSPIFENFENVINRKSTNSVDVDSWKRIQLALQNSNFDIDASIVKKGVKKDIKTVVVNSKTFKKALSRTKTTWKLEFYTGKLNAIGGKNPNIHLLIDDTEYIINCSELAAVHVIKNVNLYEVVRLAAWTKVNGKNEVIERELSEIYLNKDHFDEYKSLVNSYRENSLHKFIDNMYSISHPLLDSGRYSDFRKFMSLFVHKSWDLNVMKTMLVISKPFVEVKQIAQLRESLLLNYEAQKSKLKLRN